MLAKIVSVILMIAGLLGLLNPGAFKNRLRRKMNFTMRLIVYAFILVFAMLILGSVLRAEGTAAKMAGIVGLIVTIKVIMLITSKSSEKLSLWLEGRSLKFFRIWAAIVFVMGAMLFLS